MDRFAYMVKFFFGEFGVDILVPPKQTALTKQRSRQLGREGFCQPLNGTLVDLVQGIELGADAALVTQGEDSCRYGYYWVNHKAILEDHFSARSNSSFSSTPTRGSLFVRS
jgi:predicted nucleotide-binding protein (sugar kinase/HSP70/actin superfamily)